jgi:TolB-like protein
MLSKDKYRLPERDQVIETGNALGAQIVLAGYIYRFRERVGTKYSAESPASAAFDIHLVDVASGRILWTGRFDETQRSLSENLFNIKTFFRRKGGWITVEKMAFSALEDMIQKLP